MNALADKIYKAILAVCAATALILAAVMIIYPAEESEVTIDNTAYEKAEEKTSISQERAKQILSLEIPEPWLTNKNIEDAEMKSITYSENELKSLIESEAGDQLKIEEVTIQENGIVKLSGSISRDTALQLLGDGLKNNAAVNFAMRMAPSDIDISGELAIHSENDKLNIGLAGIKVMGIDIPLSMIPTGMSIDESVTRQMLAQLGLPENSYRLDSVQTENGSVVINYTESR